MIRSPPFTRAKGKKADKTKSEASVSTAVPKSSSGEPSPAQQAMSLSADQVKDLILNCLTNDSTIDKLVTKLADKLRSAVVDTLSETLAEAQNEIKTLRSELEATKAEVAELRDHVNLRHDDLEQYTRRSNLRVFGIPENPREDTDQLVLKLFKDKLNIDLSVERVERSHRVGKPQQQDGDAEKRPRPIIVKFGSYRDRQKVFSEKKLLKGSGVTIREDLTAHRLQVYQAAVKRYGVRSTWTQDGRILWTSDGHKGVATSHADLSRQASS